MTIITFEVDVSPCVRIVVTSSSEQWCRAQVPVPTPRGVGAGTWARRWLILFREPFTKIIGGAGG